MDTPKPIRPCFFMKTFLSAACDDAPAGVMRWFAAWHLARCPRCLAALDAMKALRTRLSALLAAPQPAETLSEGRWARLEALWAEADSRA